MFSVFSFLPFRSNEQLLLLLLSTVFEDVSPRNAISNFCSESRRDFATSALRGVILESGTEELGGWKGLLFGKGTRSFEAQRSEMFLCRELKDTMSLVGEDT